MRAPPFGILMFSMVALVFLSGCTADPGNNTDPYRGVMNAYLLSELERVRGGDYTVLDLVVENPSSYDLYTEDRYDVTAKISSLGLFDTSSETKEQTADMRGVRKKTFSWKLVAPDDLAAQADTTVRVRLQVERTATFTMPPIIFADQEYATSREVAGNPIPKGSTQVVFSDNFVDVYVDLNQAPPITTDSVHGNVKFVPKGNGLIDIGSISMPKGTCRDIDKVAKTASCEFKANPDTMVEETFQMKISYTYKLDLEKSLAIYPY
ncbi:MAG: hypothetical protein JW727_02660 [Candidatus Aenigmarchaeota archaeon]|nr:hypothetical protein [Candidatus Aenigmarchaeota archaeon]